MRTFLFVDQLGDHYVTDEDIIRDYFPWWSSRMRKAGKVDMISEERCIEDFCTVNWATEVTDK